MTRELLDDAGAVVFLRGTSREIHNNIHRRSKHYRSSKKGERTRCINDCFKNTFKNASSLHRLSGTSTGASVQYSTTTMKNCRRGKRRLNNALGGSTNLPVHRSHDQCQRERAFSSTKYTTDVKTKRAIAIAHASKE